MMVKKTTNFNNLPKVLISRGMACEIYMNFDSYDRCMPLTKAADAGYISFETGRLSAYGRDITTIITIKSSRVRVVVIPKEN